MPTHKALALAEEKELDLVEISPTANPPVCRLIEYHAARPKADRVSTLSYMAEYSDCDLDALLMLRRADNSAKNPAYKGENDDLDEFEFEATENVNKGATGNLFDIFLKK
jgi:hypothetical protein